MDAIVSIVGRLVAWLATGELLGLGALLALGNAELTESPSPTLVVLAVDS